MLKMHLIIEVLRMICAVYGIASVVQAIDKYSMYGHLLLIMEKHSRKTFSSVWSIITKASCFPSSA